MTEDALRLRRIMFVLAAINAAGETITIKEAEDLVYSFGGDPDWVLNPPPWVDELNERLKNPEVRAWVESKISSEN